ncbi:MAG: flippase-like domain-containing protein [Planctomycetaceae bacterium]|nr:flippase-like domain-containing protein [Planctomycetaceae bacterium]
MKRLLVTFLKVGVSAAIIGYLIYNATQSKAHGNVFADLRDQPKDWELLFAAWAANTFATMLTFIRWWLLIRALDVPCRFRDALRISFWGYLFNLAPLGIVGGDLVKGAMLDHEHPGHRAKAAASVIIDRVIGLYWLFVVASAAIFLTGFWRLPSPELRQIGLGMFWVTLGSTIGLAVVMGPKALTAWLMYLFRRIPHVGPPMESLLSAIQLYSRKPKVLIAASLMTVCVHLSFAVGCYCIVCGLFDRHLPLYLHFVMMPLSAVMQVIPFPVGPSEAALDFLYTNVSLALGTPVPSGQGLVVMLAYRLVSILIAALGVFYYFGNRREMAEVMHETEQAETEAADVARHSGK